MKMSVSQLQIHYTVCGLGWSVHVSTSQMTRRLQHRARNDRDWPYVTRSFKLASFPTFHTCSACETSTKMRLHSTKINNPVIITTTQPTQPISRQRSVCRVTERFVYSKTTLSPGQMPLAKMRLPHTRIILVNPRL